MVMPMISRTIKLTILYLMPLFWAVIVALVLSGTSPLKIGPAGILFVFVIFYALVSSVLFVLAHIFLKVWQILAKKQGVPIKRIYYVTSIVAFAPVFMVALNTLGQLGIVEIVLVLLLVVLGVFYVVRRTAPRY